LKAPGQHCFVYMATVQWCIGTVSLMSFRDGELKYVREIARQLGKGSLEAGFALIFISEGGKVKTKSG
jgi:hypothetical protein